MKYIYGPVKSRRLGNSLGISMVPYKVCNFDCVYCQLKNTTKKTSERKEYVSKKEILEEIKYFFKDNPTGVDHITFSGSGEPTLNKSIGYLIKAIKKIVSIPIVLITNGATFISPAVRREISGIELVIPSLDAVTQDVFYKIDRPVGGINIEDVIEGLIKFRQEFKGKIWLEIMLVRGLNDSVSYLKQIKKITDLIKPNRIQLNSPVRPPSESWVKPPTVATLKKAKNIFGNNCDIV